MTKQTKPQKHTPALDALRAIPSTGGGVNIKDGHGNVAVARIYETPGWEARATLYLAAPELLRFVREVLLQLSSTKTRNNQLILDRLMHRAKAVSMMAEGR